MADKTTVEAYMTECLKIAYEKFPDCGFMLHIVDDTKFGETTMLSNMDADEIDEVLVAAYNAVDEPAIPVDSNQRLH